MTSKQSIICLHKQGISNRDIAEKLHLSKNTVNKYVNEYDELQSQALAENPTMDPNEIIEAFTQKPKYNTATRQRRKVTSGALELIDLCLKENEAKRARGRGKQTMKKKDIWRYVCEHGYELSYGTVANVIREREEHHLEAYIRQTYEPGITCEFDWGEVELTIGNRRPRLYQMAVFTPPYSNTRYAHLYEKQDTSAFLTSHADYFAHIGGVFHQMVYDNMRVAVKRFVGPSEKEPTEALLSISLYYGFSFRFCNIASGNEKGNVERSVEYVRRRVFSQPNHDRFETLEIANKFLLEECEKLNLETDENNISANSKFTKEQKELYPIMPKYECCSKQTLTVNKYSTVVFERNHYSVPDTLVGKKVDARIYTDEIKIFSSKKLVASHSRSYRKDEWYIDIYHYLRTLKRKPGALPHSTALLKADTQIKRLYDTYYTQNAREFLDVLEIIREKGIQSVEDAIKALTILAPNDYSAEKIKIIIESKSGIGEEKAGTDVLSKISEKTLVNYDILMSMLSMKGGAMSV